MFYLSSATHQLKEKKIHFKACYIKNTGLGVTGLLHDINCDTNESTVLLFF